MNDASNRVVGNAIVGLQLLGDARSIQATVDLAQHESLLFRATAAWVMGRSKDPRYLPHLETMLEDAQGQLRKSVFNALSSIRQATAERIANPPLSVLLTKLVRRSEFMQIELLVLDRACSEPPAIKPTGFAIRVNGAPINAFQCSEKRGESRSLCLLIPGPCGEAAGLPDPTVEAALSCLRAKRPGENWRVLHYSAGAEASARVQETAAQQVPDQDSPQHAASNATSWLLQSRYTANPNRIETAITKPSSDCPARFDHALRSALDQPFPEVHAKHVLIASGSSAEIEPASLESLLERAMVNGVCVHAIALHPNVALRNLCDSTGGIYRTARNAAELLAEMAFVYFAMSQQFILRIPIAGSADSVSAVSIQVHNDSSAGQAEWRLGDTSLDLGKENFGDASN